MLQNHLLMILGWLFVALGAVGALLPVLPTTPFLIVALVLFSKSSPKLHQMLLNNVWFGPTLRQWEATKTLSRPTKYRAMALILIAFSISVALTSHNRLLQLGLIGLGLALLMFIWRIKEPPQ